jgi:hypothetical protein
MSRLPALIVPTSIMNSDTVVPQRRSSRRPLEPHLDVDVAFIHVIQVIEDDIALSFVQSNDAKSHGSIDPEGFPAGRWVHADQGVSSFNELWPGVWILAVQVRVCTAVDCFSAVDDLAEFR